MTRLFLHERLGETRAALVDRTGLVEMHILRDGDGLSAGACVPARLAHKLGRRGIADTNGEQLVVEPWPPGAAEGETVTVEVTRAAWREQGRDRLARARPTARAPLANPGLAAGLKARGALMQPGWPAGIEAEWADAFEAAELGRLAFAGGSLGFVPTPAFISVDVDGPGPALALPALLALARAIRLWGLGGSIVVDLPGLADRASRLDAAAAFDTAMGDLPFERTAINGFGLMQVVRPRPGPSILERAQLDRAGTAAIRLLDSAVRTAGSGPMRLVAAPAAARWLQARPHLLQALSRSSGRQVDVRADPMAGSGHVEVAD